MRAKMFLSVILASLLLMGTPPPEETHAAAGGAILKWYVGNNEIVVRLSANAWDSQPQALKSELFRDGSFIQRYTGIGVWYYTDAGLSQGETRTYAWSVYADYGSGWGLVSQSSVSLTTGQVEGVIDGDKTWSGGTWTCPNSPYGPGVHVNQGASLTIAPGTTVVNCGIGFYDQAARISVDGATLRNVRIYDTSSSYYGVVSIKNSTLENAMASVGAIIDLAGNTGWCTTGYFHTSMQSPVGQMTVASNRLPGCTFSAGTYPYSGGTIPSQITVQDNTLKGLTLSPGAGSFGSVSVVNNTMTDMVNVSGIFSDLTIEGNRLSTIWLSGVRSDSASDVAATVSSGNRLIRSNTFTPGASGVPIRLDNGTSNFRIEGNTVSCPDGGFQTGIGLGYGVSNNQVIGNAVSNCYAGIIYGGHDNVVQNNTIVITPTASQSKIGIEAMSPVTSTKIQDNVVACTAPGTVNAYTYGFILYGTQVSNNELVGNTARNCYYGLWLTAATTNTIQHNVFVSNTFNVYLQSWTQNNTFYDNIIKKGPGTVKNAFPSPWDNCSGTNCPNIWNIAKTPGTNIAGGSFLGGNCWSDYTGADPDGDGLGNTPYTIDANNMDNLPLVPRAGSGYLVVDPFTLDTSRITFSGGRYRLPVDITIRNSGCAAAAASNVQIRFSDNSGWSSSQAIAQIPADGSATIRLDWDITNILTPGNGQATVQLTVRTDNHSRSNSAPVDARPRITHVEPEYFPGWFMAGVHVLNKFEATVDWNGQLAGLGEDQTQNVIFELEGLQATEPGNGQTKVSHTFDMGYDMHEGRNLLSIYARNAANFYADKNLTQIHQTAVPQWLFFLPGVQSTFEIERVSRPGPDLVIYRTQFKFPGEVVKGAVAAGAQAGPASGRFGPTIPAWELKLEEHSTGRGRITGIAGITAEAKSKTFEGSLGGGVEAMTQVDGQDKVRLAELWAIIKGSAKFKSPKWRLPQAPVIYLQLAGGLDVEGRLGAEENRATGKLEFKRDLILRLEPMFEAAVVAGEKGLAWVEGAFGGKARGEFQFFTSPAVRSALLRSYLRIAAGVLWFEKVQTWTWTWVLVGAQSGEAELWLVGQPEPMGAAEWQPIPRDYLTPGYATFAGDHPSADGPSAILTESYPYADPAAAYLGNGQVLAVWVHDDGSKQQHQGLEMQSSLWTSATWSTPLSLTNDLIMDWQPTVAATPNGALAAWTRLRDVVTGTLPVSPTQLYNQMEIAYATYNAAGNSWSAPQLLTNNGVMDFLPNAKSQLGQTMLLWLQDPDNNFPTFPTDLTPLAEDIYYAVWNGASWTISSTLALSNVATGEQPQFAYDGRRAVLVWSQDTDGNPTTVTDTELFYATWNVTTTTWSATTQPITSNTLADLSPRLAYDSAGLAHLLWVQEIADADNPNDARSRLYHATFNGSAWSSPILVLEEPGIEGLQVLSDERDNLIAIWRGVADNQNDLYRAIYDFQYGSWSRPAPLTQDRDAEWAYDAVYDDRNDRVFLVLLKRQVGTEVVSVEFPTSTLSLGAPPVAGIAPLSETVPITLPKFNQSSLVQLTHTPAPDLAITTTDIALLPANPLPGSTALISATVRNAGDLAANPVKVAFYDGDPSAGGTLIGSVQSLATSLTGGLTATLAVSWPVPITPTPHTLYVKVDPLNEVAEADEGNNQAVRITGLPDLVVAYAYVSGQGTQHINLAALISNTGSYTATGVQAEYHLAAITGTLLGQTSLATIPAGQSDTLFFSWNVSSTTPATYTIYVLADPANTITEAEETNNVGLLWADILPDLALTSADVSGEGPIGITVHNTGLVTATGVLVEVRQGSLTGTLLYSGTIASIAPAGAESLQVTLAPGSYTLYVEADPTNVVPETDKSNNLAVRAVTIPSRLYLPLILRGS